jgi:hypothetical protein
MKSDIYSILKKIRGRDNSLWYFCVSVASVTAAVSTVNRCQLQSRGPGQVYGHFQEEPAREGSGRAEGALFHTATCVMQQT